MSTKQNRVPTAPAKARVAVDKADLVEAWSLLENLAVSLDQIGGALDDPEDRRFALEDYISGDLARAINEARMKLGRYLPDAEAEELSENSIPYWNYKGLKKGKYTRPTGT